MNIWETIIGLAFVTLILWIIGRLFIFNEKKKQKGKKLEDKR